MEKILHKEQTSSREKVRILVQTGLFAALGCVATMVLQVPSPNGGYMNLGDAVVILGAWLLGPVYGAIAGGVGPAMADLLSGYVMYVPATLMIKAAMAVTAALLYRAFRKRGLLVCAAAAEILMIAGYWLFDAFLTYLAGGSSFAVCLAGSAVGLPSNFVQGVFGGAASVLLALAFRHSAFVRKTFPNL